MTARINEKTVQKILLFIIVAFILYKTFLPVTDPLVGWSENDPYIGMLKPFPNATFDKVLTTFEVVEGKDSYLITGHLRGTCDVLEKTEYCPTMMLEIDVNGITPYLFSSSLGRIRNKTFIDQGRQEFFLGIKKPQERLEIEYGVTYKILDPDMAKEHNRTSVVLHREKEEILLPDSPVQGIEVDLQRFSIMRADGKVMIEAKGTTGPDRVNATLYLAHRYRFGNIIFHEERVNVKEGRFSHLSTISTQSQERIQISAIIMVRADDSFFVAERTLSAEGTEHEEYQ